ncbi:DUF5333 domain-containing protein [Actibacterium sp. MT2.3-13A]|uniref:DUF5333 domain-containing protein n=1 Tax=Actibacterium sp. MT2.3-13A TaxID=2828332 RepID=UPI001BA4EEB1|nr:DUF5333 domain-containing protein [Actibacterium sp. MT2.3-13A]
MWGRRIRSGIMAALAAGSMAQATAQALPPINQDEHIMNSLLAAAIGDEIRKNCPTISPRLFKVWSEAKALERYALDKGYTEEEIEALLDSKPERKAMRARRDAYLAANGVVAGDAGSYCALGEREIAAGSLTGSLLQAQ